MSSPAILRSLTFCLLLLSLLSLPFTPLCRPQVKYAPWFRTVLKSAQVAVSVIGMLSEEARASRLSFNDIAKRLSEQADKTATYISKRVGQLDPDSPCMHLYVL